MEMPNSPVLTRRSVLAGSAVLGAGAAALAATGTINLSGGSLKLDSGTGPIPLAVILDDGATMIDFAGPWEVFQDATAANVPGFHLYTVAHGAGPYQTSGNDGDHPTGLKFMPDYTFANAPQPKVVIMGAQDGSSDPVKLAWIRAVAAKADVVMSVCTGAFVIANTGLLDGLSATTHPLFFDQFAKKFPKVKLVRGTRFVDNGKFVTAGGLTAGMDAALHVVQRYYGPAATQQVADYMQYQSTGWKA